METFLLEAAPIAVGAMLVLVALHFVLVLGLREQLDAALSKTTELAHKLERLNKRREALAKMRVVWGGSDSAEKDCHDLLYDNIWVLEPEFVAPGNRALLTRRALRTVFREIGFEVPQKPNKYWHLLKDVEKDFLDYQPDICGVMNKRTSVGLPYQSCDQEVLLIVELKKGGKAITRKEFDQVHNYASLFRRLPNSVQAWTTPIECLVIGHELEDDISDASMRWGSDTRSSITIRPVRYADLLSRAEKLCEIFMDIGPDEGARVY